MCNQKLHITEARNFSIFLVRQSRMRTEMFFSTRGTKRYKVQAHRQRAAMRDKIKPVYNFVL